MKIINSIAFVLALSFIVHLALITHKWYKYTYLTYYCMGNGDGTSFESDIYRSVINNNVIITLFFAFVFVIIYLVRYFSKSVRGKANG